MDIEITRRQAAFLKADANEVLFGGAAGGGKSYAQIIDAFLFALKYPLSKQLILRRTFPELEKSLIRTSLGLYPREVYSYNASKHTGIFKNGSVIDFGYCDAENDVYKYQSAEYDIIRFDELTHFTEDMYIYLLSRVRGVNGYPKQVKATTNPGGIGHSWVKARFIDIGQPNLVHEFPHGSRVFLPARVQDNRFLMEHDPEYLRRLENLSDRDRRALLHGDWDIFDGQYFTEWSRERHVIAPFPIPDGWRKYFTMDYGLDMLAGYWIALDDAGNAYVYREIYEQGLIISEAAARICALDDRDTFAYIAPPDLWNRRQDTGRSAAQIFSENGVPVVRAENNRIQGWLALHEWLTPRENEFGKLSPRLRIFSSCVNLIRTLPALAVSQKNPNDAASEPHELTHAPDALRYFVASQPTARVKHTQDENRFDDEISEFLSFGI